MAEQPRDQETPEQRKRRLAAVFGTVLPESTSDDRPEPVADPDPDRWYEENRPPHHG